QPLSGLPAGFQFRDDPPAVAAVAAPAAAESQDAAAAAAAAAAATASPPRQVFLSPTGVVVIGFPTAQAYAKVYQGRVTADQKTKANARKRDVCFTVPG
ncbi:unnamed protein product, partial [Laminaria digitata]